MVQHDDLRGEGFRDGWWAIRGPRDIPPAQVLFVDSPDVESDVVSRLGLRELLVVHLDRLHLADLVCRDEVHFHPDLHDARLNPADRHGPGARDRIDVLDGKPKRQVRRLLRDREIIQCGHEGGPLVPPQLRARLRNVLPFVRADGDERDLVHLEPGDLQEARELRLELREPLLGIFRLRRVHLVNGDDQLFDPQNLRKEDVLLRLRLDAFRGPDHEDGRIRLGRARDHVLDEVPVARRVDDREVVLVRVKTLVRDVDREAALPLLLHLVHDEGELEGGLAHLLGELLEILEFVGVDVPGVVQDPADGRRLPVVDVADEYEVEVGLRGHGVLLRGELLNILSYLCFAGTGARVRREGYMNLEKPNEETRYKRLAPRALSSCNSLGKCSWVWRPSSFCSLRPRRAARRHVRFSTTVSSSGSRHVLPCSCMTRSRSRRSSCATPRPETTLPWPIWSDRHRVRRNPSRSSMRMRTGGRPPPTHSKFGRPAAARTED